MVASLYLRLLLTAMCLASISADDVTQCKAVEYASPGYQTNRQHFSSDPVWNGVAKVALPTADCTWLSGNFLDTGSSFVAVFFGGLTAHKETWPFPWLAQALATTHGISSLTVDHAGRGESCGYEWLPGYGSKVEDIKAAIGFVNRLPGRHCGVLFGMSTAATAALYYASAVGDVPAIMMAEPDDLVSMSDFVDDLAGGDVLRKLQRTPQYEVIQLNTHDRMMMTAESNHELRSRNLTDTVSTIPSDVHMYWYTAEFGSSMTSEMANLTADFMHITKFTFRQFNSTGHSFGLGNTSFFIDTVTADIASEADNPAFTNSYISEHKVVSAAPACSREAQGPVYSCSGKFQTVLRRPSSKVMPKHFWVDQQYRSSGESGLVNPAAAYIRGLGWVLVVMPYRGCSESICSLQVTHAGTAPLVAQMGNSTSPDPRNITNPVQAFFDLTKWAAVAENVGAHPNGGLGFSSYRALAYKKKLYVTYAVEIFDASPNETRSDQHNMRFQGTGIAQVQMHTCELHNVAMFVEPLIPRRVFPCCDKNWGMLEDEGQLYIIYTLLPTLTIFTMDLESPSHPNLTHASYLANSTASWLEKMAGLGMHDVRISGHPIMYSEFPKTLLLLAHNNWRKHNGSKHWAIQMKFDPAFDTFVISAVSQNPVLDHESFILHNGNKDVMNEVAIGSYHIDQNYLRILFGDGNKYAAYNDICLSSIAWLQLNETDARPWTGGVDVDLGDKIDSLTYTV